MDRLKYAALLVLVACTACGYSGRALLPSHIKTVYIPPFVNDTTRSGIEQDITTAVTDAFVADGRLRVVAEGEADSVLRGVIIKYETGPLTFDRAQTVNEFKVEVAVSVEFEDVREGKTLWKEDQFRAWKSYQQDLGPTAEGDAFTTVVGTLSSDIVSRTVEGW